MKRSMNASAVEHPGVAGAVRRRPGLCVAVLGADGSGKTTVIGRLREHLARTQPSAPLYLHFRPRLGSRVDGALPVTQPHGEPPRGPLLSTAKLLYYLFDFAAGWACKVGPARRQGRVIIFDRYFSDLLIDPRRYRQGRALVSARAVAALIPEPDLIIVLDAPASVLQARKQEVSFQESERVREGYLALARSAVRAQVVDASRPADQVFDDVRRLVEARLVPAAAPAPRAL